MLAFIFRKMNASRWLMASLLLGNLLLFAVVAAIPMYTDAITQSVMRGELAAVQAEQGRYAGTLHAELTARRASAYRAAQDAGAQLGALTDSYGVPVLAASQSRSSFTFRYDSLTERTQQVNSRSAALRCRSGFAAHVELVRGRMFADTRQDGIVEVVVNERTFLRQDLMLDEVFQFDTLTDEAGEPVRFQVVGVYRAALESDPYWYASPGTEGDVLMVSEAVFDEVLGESYRSRYSMTFTWDAVIDDQQLDVAQLGRYVENTGAWRAQMEEAGAKVEITFARTLERFVGQADQLGVLLLLLLVPILAMLAFFLFMVSRQILEQERTTIAVLRSRGASRGQVVGIFVVQGALVCLVCAAVGLPLGYLLCKALGAANGFLNLVQRTALPLRFVPASFAYVAVAAAGSLLTMVLPAVVYAGQGIVAHKRGAALSARAPQAVLLLALAALAVSLYGWYSFRNQLSAVVGQEAAVDPLLYVAASIFLLGAGVAVALLLPQLWKLIYRLGRSRWSPPAYAAFLRAQRAAADQRFLTVFMVLTIAVGVFNATTARTINQQVADNLAYRNGADLVLRQVWQDNRNDEQAEMRIYYEPDFRPYEQLAQTHDMALAKVLNSTRYTVGDLATRVMGIETEAFAAVANLRADLLPAHFYTYLNTLAQDPSAVLLSENYKTLGYALGDRIEIVNENGVTFPATVYGFFPYWPTYFEEDVVTDYWGERSLQEQWLIVGNLPQMQLVWGVEPYEIWIRTQDTDAVYAFAAEQNLTYERFTDTAADLVDEKNDPTLQGTNGVLTVGFILVLVVCMVGFLIFWILSIRARTLQFGVFRAMGMPMSGVFRMLLCEQALVSLASVAAGAGVGALASRLFVPLIQLSYTAMDVSLPLRIVAERGDYLRLLGVFGAVFVLCLGVLVALVKKIRIARALKLGED